MLITSKFCNFIAEHELGGPHIINSDNYLNNLLEVFLIRCISRRRVQVYTPLGRSYGGRITALASSQGCFRVCGLSLRTFTTWWTAGNKSDMDNAPRNRNVIFRTEYFKGRLKLRINVNKFSITYSSINHWTERHDNIPTYTQSSLFSTMRRSLSRSVLIWV